jgi:hypothetical protein
MVRSWLSKVDERGALVGAGLSDDVEMPAAIILRNTKSSPKTVLPMQLTLFEIDDHAP